MESSTGHTSWNLIPMMDGEENDTPTVVTHRQNAYNSVFSYVMDLGCVSMLCSSSHRCIDMSPQRQRQLADEKNDGKSFPSSSCANRMSPVMPASGSVYSDACSEQGIPSSSCIGSVVSSASLSSVGSSAKTVIMSPYGRPPRTNGEETQAPTLSPPSYLSYRKSTVVTNPRGQVSLQGPTHAEIWDNRSPNKNKLGLNSFGERSNGLVASSSPIYRRSMPADYADETTVMSIGTEQQSETTITGSPTTSAVTVGESPSVVRLNPYTTRQINHRSYAESRKQLVRKDSGQSESESSVSTLSTPSTHTTGASTTLSPSQQQSPMSGSSRHVQTQQQQHQYYYAQSSIRKSQSHVFFGTDNSNRSSPQAGPKPFVTANDNDNPGILNSGDDCYQKRLPPSTRLFYRNARSPVSAGMKFSSDGYCSSSKDEPPGLHPGLSLDFIA